MKISMRKINALLIVLFLLLASSTVIIKPNSSAEKIENSWTTKASMPKAINGAKAAAVNGKIYVIGDDANFEYNPVTNTWTGKKPMPTARMFFEIAVYQNRIYAIGGRSSGITFGANEVYDPSTDTWTTKKEMPINISDIEANVVNGKIHLIGTDRHDVYDITTDSWTTKNTTHFPHPDYGYSSAVVNSKIYIIGWNQTHIYDPKSDSWSLGASTPTAVQDAAACATTGIMALKRIYVIGGMSGGSIEGTSITQVYVPETDNWTYGASMPTNRGWLEAVVVDDIIYAIAGRSCAICPELGVNEQYTPFGYGTPDPSYDGTAPQVTLISPENKTYYKTSLQLDFLVNEPVYWIRYKLDNETEAEILGNTTITELSFGSHSITVYATDEADNTGSSQTIHFTITEQVLEPLPTTLVISAVVAVVIISVGLAVYFKRRKHKS